MTISYRCTNRKCQRESFVSVFMLPGEEVPEDVRFRRWLNENLTDLQKAKLKKGDRLGVMGGGSCGRCLAERAKELGFITQTPEQILAAVGAQRAPDMEVEIF